MPIKRRRHEPDATVAVPERIAGYAQHSQFRFEKGLVPQSLARDSGLEAIAVRTSRTERGAPIDTNYYLDRRGRRKGPNERRQASGKRRQNPERRNQEGVSQTGQERRIKQRRAGQQERRSASAGRRTGSLERRGKARKE